MMRLEPNALHKDFVNKEIVILEQHEEHREHDEKEELNV